MVLDLRKSANHTVWAKIALFFLAVLRFDSKIFFFLPSCQARTCIKDLLELKDLHVVTEVYIVTFSRNSMLRSRVKSPRVKNIQVTNNTMTTVIGPIQVTLRKKTTYVCAIHASKKSCIEKQAHTHTHLYKPMKHCFIFKETPTTNITNSTGPIWLLVRHRFKFSLLLCLRYPQVDLSKPWNCWLCSRSLWPYGLILPTQQKEQELLPSHEPCWKYAFRLTWQKFAYLLAFPKHDQPSGITFQGIYDDTTLQIHITTCTLLLSLRPLNKTFKPFGRRSHLHSGGVYFGLHCKTRKILTETSKSSKNIHA